MTQDPDDEHRIEARPPLHAPRVHTMGMNHIPVTALVTVAIAYIYGLAFHLGTMPGLASTVLLAALFGLAAIAPRRSGPDGAAPKDTIRANPDPLTGATSGPGEKITAGTRFTIVRVAIACLLGGLVLAPDGPHPDAMYWSLIVFGVAAALLEASDGWLAQVTRSASSYSERLSDVTAAAFVLALAVLPWQLGLVGPWVLLAGILGAVEVFARTGAGTDGRWRLWARLALRFGLLAVLVPPLAGGLAVVPAGIATVAALTLVIPLRIGPAAPDS